MLNRKYPVEIKKFVNPFTALQIVFYLSLSLRVLVKIGGLTRASIFKGALVDYFIGIYFSIIILLTTFRVMNEKLTSNTP